MSQHRQYVRAPIAEAVIAIETLPADTFLSADGANPDPQHFDYLDQLMLRAFQSSQGPAGATTRLKESPVGFMYQAKQGGFRVQVLRHGMVLSWVKANPNENYPGWDAFQDLAKRLWTGYRDKVKAPSLSGLGVRYINQLLLDLSGPGPHSLEAYLRTLPELSQDLRYQSLSAYALQLHMPQPDLKAMAVMNQAILPPPRENQLCIGLDIDLRQQGNLPEIDDVEKLWGCIEALHDREYEVFEASITDRARRYFQEDPR